MSRGLRIFFIVSISFLVVIAAGFAALWFSPLLGRNLPETSITYNPDSLETKEGQFSPSENQNRVDFDPSSNDAPTQTVSSSTKESASPNPSQTLPSDFNLTENINTPFCGGPNKMSILIVGLDERIQADAIRLVRVDFVKSSVSILSIPRDFYVPIVDMDPFGITEGRINATYGYGETLLGKNKGITSLTNNLTYNFGVSFDHYLVLHLDDIATYIDKVGGVDLYLDQPVSDGWSDFSSGDHHFDGETAVIFMRMRLFDNDFARVRRQSMVLRAFFNKSMRELNPIEQTQLAIKVLADKAIQTNFSIKDISPLICLARSIQSENVTFFEVEESMYRSFTTSGGANVLIPNNTVVPYIQSVMDGTNLP